MKMGNASQLSLLAESLRGCDVMVSGSSASGHRFVDRSLGNVTMTTTQDGEWLISGVDGIDPDGGARIRSFRLDRLTNLRITAGPMAGATVSRDDAGGPWMPGGVDQPRGPHGG